MPALNFQKHLPPLIRDGSKVFTLRALRKDKRDAQTGQILYMFTGQRHADCEKFNTKPCRFAMTVKVSWRSIRIPTIGHIESSSQLETYARLDGFNNYQEFCQYHEISLSNGTKLMRMISWITRDELAERLEVKP
jgi:hypothetical protein